MSKAQCINCKNSGNCSQYGFMDFADCPDYIEPEESEESMTIQDKIRKILNWLYDKAIFHLNNIFQQTDVNQALSALTKIMEEEKFLIRQQFIKDLPPDFTVYGYTLYELKQIIDFSVSKNFKLLPPTSHNGAKIKGGGR